MNKREIYFDYLYTNYHIKILDNINNIDVSARVSC